MEGMQEETTVMKQRIAELEAENAEKSNQMTATAPADLTAPLVVDKQASAELQRVQADLDSLNDTLNNERKARRATELELLNTKNRHEKFVADLPVQISEEEHQREITDREKQIDALKRQTTHQQHHPSKIELLLKTDIHLRDGLCQVLFRQEKKEINLLL